MAAHRDHSRADSTSTSRRSTESTPTLITRTPDRCSRTCITSDIEASPWIRRFRYSPIPARPQPHSKDFTPPNPRFRAGPTYPPGRHCATDNCTARLSIYNPTDHCHPHAPHRYPRPPIPTQTEPPKAGETIGRVTAVGGRSSLPSPFRRSGVRPVGGRGRYVGGNSPRLPGPGTPLYPKARRMRDTGVADHLCQIGGLYFV